MAIGIPAYHQEDFMIPPTLPPEVIWQALQHMRWTGSGSPDGLHFRVSAGLSFGSWGENITVSRIAPDRITVRSESSFPTQVIDWGRNENNVKRFFATLVALAQGQAPPVF
jgi:hypothetical protein